VTVVDTPAFFDDRELLRLMLGLHEQGRLAYLTGEQLMQEAGGYPGLDAQRVAFVRELHVARDDQLIDFELGRILAQPDPRPEESAYLQNLRNFRLRIEGRDRARGEVVREPQPDPEHDDGRLIPTRILEIVGRALAEPLHGGETRSFLLDAGIPAEQLPDFRGEEEPYVRAVLLRMLERGSSGRRVVRELIGRWLDDELDIGPTSEHRRQIVPALARLGWHVVDGTLVIGERVKVTADRGDVALADADPLPRVVHICRRFNEVARQLTRRYNKRATLKVGDEHDVQDLMHALLRMHFEDVRTESWNPAYLGGGSRSDLLLPEAGIVIEVKKARESLRDTGIGSELAEDITRYGDVAANRGAAILVCFIYDPDRLLANPRGLERDLASASTERLQVLGVVG
jgi:hypothetical protein